MGRLRLRSRHRLLCGDSTKAEDVERLMDGEQVGSVVTDPPYGMKFRSNYRKKSHRDIEGDEDESLLMHACSIEADHSRYIWSRWNNLRSVQMPNSVVVWVKNNWSMGDLEHEHARQTEICLFYAGRYHRWPTKRPTDVLNHARTNNDLHPTEKPVALISEVVGWTEGLVFDPFLGSGTTLIAAEQLDRRCFGMEIDPAYCDIIVKRWENLTGEKAVLADA